MPPVDPLSAIFSYAPEVFQGIKGISDLFTGNAFGNTPRPQYNIPPEVAQQVALARNQASSPILPGAGLIKNQIGGNTAAGVNTAIQGGNPQGSIGALVNNQNNQFENLAFKGIEHQDKAIGAYGSALENEAQYKDKAFDINEMQPYKYAQQAANTYTQGGLSELFNSLKGGGQTYMLLDMLNKLKKNGGGMAPGWSGGGGANGGGGNNGGGGGGGLDENGNPR